MHVRIINEQFIVDGALVPVGQVILNADDTEGQALVAAGHAEQIFEVLGSGIDGNNAMTLASLAQIAAALPAGTTVTGAAQG